MTTKVRRRVSYELEHDGRTFPTTYEACDYTDTTIKVLPDGRAVVGYLAQDTDCNNPLDDCDGMGHIYDRRSRNSTREERRKAEEALGIDEYGNRVAKPDPFAVLLDVYSHSGDVWRLHGSGRYFPDERWDVSNGAGVWVPDDCCREHIAYEACCSLLPGVDVAYVSKYNADGTVKMLADGKTPDPRFFNRITYALPDGRKRGGFKSFLTAIRAAAKVLGVKLDKKAIDVKAREVAVTCAEQAVAEFNRWLAGEVYGVVVETYDQDNDPQSEDACWGRIGTEYAQETLAEEVESTYERLLKEDKPDVADSEQSAAGVCAGDLA